MTSIKVFLTKSSEAAYAIAHGYGCDMQKNVNGIKSVQCGPADGKEIVPAIYHNKGYFYCAAAYENSDGSEAPKYELIIC
jgi:hypothetical protein